MEASRVTVDPDPDAPSIRVEPNRPFVVITALATVAALIVGVVIAYRPNGLVAVVALMAITIFGVRFIYLIGPARVFTRPWIAADREGITARTARGITRYGWDRIESVGWQSAGRPIGRYTVVEITPTLGAPDDPYGPINPFEVSLWFLGRKRRSLEVGRDFLSVCRRYGAETTLLVGNVRES